MSDSQEAVAYRAALEVVRAVEPFIAEAIADELDNQRYQLKLIASENYASPAVLLAMGNWLSDKYAEGTPGRFYAGCQVVDRVEAIANEHARALFGADHAYVQTRSVSPTSMTSRQRSGVIGFHDVLLLRPLYVVSLRRTYPSSPSRGFTPT